MRANSERGRDFEDQQLELVWGGIGNEGKLQGQKGHNEREPLMMTPIMISSKYKIIFKFNSFGKFTQILNLSFWNIFSSIVKCHMCYS